MQKSGHGSLVETQDGVPYIAHLTARPLASNQRSMLGRETALQRCVWTKNGWLRLASGGQRAELTVQPPLLAPAPWEQVPVREHFDSGEWNMHLSSLRVPLNDSWVSLKERPGYMRQRGRDSLFSIHEQSFIARRLQSVHAAAETCVEFEPDNYHQTSGLTLFYDQNMFYYLRIYYSEMPWHSLCRQRR